MASKKLSIAVADDEEEVLDLIATSISRAFRRKEQDVEIATFSSPKALAKEMRTTQFSLIFLDIDMPEIDGIKFVKLLQREKYDAQIIFVSNREDKVFEAFRLHPFGFVRKSNFLKDITAVVDSYLISFKPEEDPKKLVIQHKGLTESIPLSEIIYIEGNRQVQSIYAADRKEPVQVRRTMKELEEELKDKGFLRIHKGFIVNYRYIRVIEKTEVVITTETRLPVSRSSLKDVREKYVRLLQGDGSEIY